MDPMFMDLAKLAKQEQTHMNELLDTISSIEHSIDNSKALLICTVKDLLYYMDCEVVINLKEPCAIRTWNKGYDFTVTGFKKRKSDNNIMMCGKYCGKDETEFLSYIWGYDSVVKLTEAINNSFFKQIDWSTVVA